MKGNLEIEGFIYIISIITSIIGTFLILRSNWKQYGVLYIISAVIGEVLCFLFVQFGFYSFPYRFFPEQLPMPVFAIVTVFPFYVLLGVRYSPVSWVWKIPFYYTIINIGMTIETWAQVKTELIKYERFWDVWDSYTWWWLYFLMMEWVGGLIVAKEFRKPILNESFKYGKIAWFLSHFVMVITIFLAGYYLGLLK